MYAVIELMQTYNSTTKPFPRNTDDSINTDLKYAN